MRIIIILFFILSLFNSNLFSKIGLLIPLYSCPSDNSGKIWEEVYKAGRKLNIIVIWGIICPNDNYIEILKKFHEKGIKNVAYISTGNSTRPFEAIKEKIKKYEKFPVDGFFFDEVNISTNSYNYNQQIFNYVKRETKRLVIINSPYIDSNFLKKLDVDVAVIFEDNCKEINNFNFKIYKNLKKPEVALIVHHCAKEKIDKILRIARKNNIKWLYITDKNYDELPSYFNRLLSNF